MKGLIMDINKKDIIILTAEGSFEKIKNKYANNIGIGEEIDTNMVLKDTKFRKKYLLRYIAALTVCCFILLSGFAFYHKPYGYINVDINPSVEMTYNYFGKVIKVKALNEDGDKILGKLKNFNGNDVEGAIEKVIMEARNQEYISNNTDDLVVVTVVDERNRVNENKVVNEVRESKNIQGLIDVELLEGTKEEHKEAKEKGKLTAEVIIENKLNEINQEKQSEKLSNVKMKKYERIAEQFNKKDKGNNEVENPSENNKSKVEDKKSSKDEEGNENNSNGKNNKNIDNKRDDNSNSSEKGKMNKEENNKENKGQEIKNNKRQNEKENIQVDNEEVEENKKEENNNEIADKKRDSSEQKKEIEVEQKQNRSNRRRD
ncbi:MAG: anti-sigma factor domain-containing protein [Eubacteriales bacterium]